MYACSCTSAALNRLRVLITFGDVPLVAVTCTNEALYETILKNDSSAFSKPLIEPRGPSAYAQWNMREGRADPSQRHAVKTLRSPTLRRGVVLQKGMMRWSRDNVHMEAKKFAKRTADFQTLQDEADKASKATLSEL